MMEFMLKIIVATVACVFYASLFLVMPFYLLWQHIREKVKW